MHLVENPATRRHLNKSSKVDSKTVVTIIVKAGEKNGQANRKLST